ncbi:hypothetical protein H696_01295 [Fonticula alba]|uniref:Uncharacterized protein n=1 Tax=Fonticula alba TaxID=691883 RepID=A0A058ZD73_FONAL|nr:hypothetical protein H696_01295 [Fonticula alba]KCV71886.1 hypothetical protein H696_01295 [Fonticula alba]|eukprot:XP_009493464.1 hypothetical protein H696_01295 [Fonticula alba]
MSNSPFASRMLSTVPSPLQRSESAPVSASPAMSPGAGSTEAPTAPASAAPLRPLDSLFSAHMPAPTDTASLATSETQKPPPEAADVEGDRIVTGSSTVTPSLGPFDLLAGDTAAPVALTTPSAANAPAEPAPLLATPTPPGSSSGSNSALDQSALSSSSNRVSRLFAAQPTSTGNSRSGSPGPASASLLSEPSSGEGRSLAGDDNAPRPDASIEQQQQQQHHQQQPMSGLDAQPPSPQPDDASGLASPSQTSLAAALTGPSGLASIDLSTMSATSPIITTTTITEPVGDLNQLAAFLLREIQQGQTAYTRDALLPICFQLSDHASTGLRDLFSRLLTIMEDAIDKRFAMANQTTLDTSIPLADIQRSTKRLQEDNVRLATSLSAIQQALQAGSVTAGSDQQFDMTEAATGSTMADIMGKLEALSTHVTDLRNSMADHSRRIDFVTSKLSPIISPGSQSPLGDLFRRAATDAVPADAPLDPWTGASLPRQGGPAVVPAPLRESLAQTQQPPSTMRAAAPTTPTADAGVGGHSFFSSPAIRLLDELARRRPAALFLDTFVQVFNDPQNGHMRPALLFRYFGEEDAEDDGSIAVGDEPMQLHLSPGQLLGLPADWASLEEVPKQAPPSRSLRPVVAILCGGLPSLGPDRAAAWLAPMVAIIARRGDPRPHALHAFWASILPLIAADSALSDSLAYVEQLIRVAMQ